jgi:exosortase
MRCRNFVVLPLIAWLYAPLLARLFARWMYDPFLSHGLFVPAFALLVLWRGRNKLKTIEAAPSLAGLPLVGLAIFMRNSTFVKGDLFLSGVSLLLLLAGVIILIDGWEFFRAVLFPWTCLILMMPVPGVLQNISFSLQAPTLKLAAFLLQLAGVPVVQEGNVINLPNGPILFDYENGIRTLMTPLTLAIMHAYFADNRKWVRAGLVCSSVPIAIVADSFAIVGTCLVSWFSGLDEAANFFRFQGWLVFAASLIMLFVLHRLILHVWRDSPEAKYSMQLSATDTSTLESCNQGVNTQISAS